MTGRRGARPEPPAAGAGWERLLTPLTPVYGAVVRVRAAAYRRGWLSAERLPVPVVSVGNLTFGGTGKTPTVRALVRDLVRRGRRPAVLTRGHGRSDPSPGLLVGPSAGADPVRWGDEPVELSRSLPGVPIVVDADRARGGRRAAEIGVDVAVLDDGFQHLAVARDLDLVLVDAGDPWGGGALPPRGRLREPATALARADCVLVTKVEGPADPRLGKVAEEVGRLAPGTPVEAARLEPVAVRTTEGRGAVDRLAGRRVVAFAGLGRPGGFAAMLREVGAEVVETRWFPDHHRYRADDVRRIAELARRHRAVPVTTAKDAVKLPARLGEWVVEVRMVPLAGDWDRIWALAPEVVG